MEYLFFFVCYGDHRELHVLTHSFPTRRSSDLHERLLDRPRLLPEPAGAGRNRTPAAGQLRRSGPPAGRELHRLFRRARQGARSEEHTSELQSLMRISYAVFCLQKKKYTTKNKYSPHYQYENHLLNPLTA